MKLITTLTRPITSRLFPEGDLWYWRFRKLMTPGLRNAQYAYFETLDATLDEGDHWLDLGCGRRLVPSWMRNASEVERNLLDRAGRLVGIDPDAEALAENPLPILKYEGSAEHVPEPDESFDVITANMVAEHLECPEQVLREAARLLRPGGRLLLHTPNLWYPATAIAACAPTAFVQQITSWMEKRDAEDIYPTRYRLNRPATIRRLAQFVGLTPERVYRAPDSPETIRLGPLVAGELAVIAMTRTRLLHGLQSNLIVTLTKPDHGEATEGLDLYAFPSQPLPTIGRRRVRGDAA